MREKIGDFQQSAESEKTKELIGKTEDKIKEVATLINQTREEGFDIKKINHPYINILSRNIVSRKKMISLFEMNGSEEVLWEGNHSNIEEGIKEIESLIAQMKESGIIISDLYKRYNN